MRWIKPAMFAFAIACGLGLTLAWLQDEPGTQVMDAVLSKPRATLDLNEVPPEGSANQVVAPVLASEVAASSSKSKSGAAPGVDDFAQYRRLAACLGANEAELARVQQKLSRPPAAEVCKGLTAADLSSTYVHLQRAARAGLPEAAVPYADAGLDGANLTRGVAEMMERQVDEFASPAGRLWWNETRELLYRAAVAGNYEAIGSMTSRYDVTGTDPDPEKHDYWMRKWVPMANERRAARGDPPLKYPFASNRGQQ